MGFTYNGSTPSRVTYNGTPVQKITYNGVAVWAAVETMDTYLNLNGTKICKGYGLLSIEFWPEEDMGHLAPGWGIGNSETFSFHNANGMQITQESLTIPSNYKTWGEGGQSRIAADIQWTPTQYRIARGYPGARPWGNWINANVGTAPFIKFKAAITPDAEPRLFLEGSTSEFPL